MPDAAERVMDERPRITEQHDASNEGAEEPLYVSVRARSQRGSDQPPGNEREAEIEHEAGDAVKARHQERQRPPVNLDMRRDGTVPAGQVRLSHVHAPTSSAAWTRW